MHHILSHLSGIVLYGVVALTVFGETGIVALFFLPGDSMLFSLGMLAYDQVVPLHTAIIVIAFAAFFGNILGYYLGTVVRNRRTTNHLLQRIPEKYVVKTELFYAKYGTWAVFLSRFVPVVRTAAPFLAGISRMNRRHFILFSAVGAVLWPLAVVILGFSVGSYFDIRHVEYISAGLMLFATILTVVGVYIAKRSVQKNRT